MKTNYQEIYINMDDSGVLHPNEKCCVYGGIVFTKKLEQENFDFSNLIEFMKPMSFADYNKLQVNTFCAISDSGTITEESAIMGFPAITIRQAHERPEGMDEGTLIMSGLKADDVCAAIDCVTNQLLLNNHLIRTVPDYDVDNVAEKVVRIILSYTEYVNRTVWGKA